MIFVPARSRFVPVTLLALSISLSACLGSDPPPKPGLRAKGREGDPALVHQWTMPADSSVMQSADLGSEPPALAEALMSGAAAPGISHRISTACASKGVLAGVATLALRWSITDDGKLGAIEGDPEGEAATCMADALRTELEPLGTLPAGAALMVLEFHAKPPR